MTRIIHFLINGTRDEINGYLLDEPNEHRAVISLVVMPSDAWCTLPGLARGSTPLYTAVVRREIEADI